jgi:hypothetical protein
MNGFIDILRSNVILATKHIYYIYNFIYIDFFNLTSFENFLPRERKLEKKLYSTGISVGDLMNYIICSHSIHKIRAG